MAFLLDRKGPMCTAPKTSTESQLNRSLRRGEYWDRPEVVNLVIVEHRKRGGEGEGTTFVPGTHSYWGFGLGLARQSY